LFSDNFYCSKNRSCLAFVVIEMTSIHEYTSECRICYRECVDDCFINKAGVSFCFKCLNLNPDKLVYLDMKMRDLAQNMVMEDLPSKIKAYIFHTVKNNVSNINMIVSSIWNMYCDFLSQMDPESAVDHLIKRMMRQDQKTYIYTCKRMNCDNIETLVRYVIRSVHEIRTY
jgi:hypothetical protein